MERQSFITERLVIRPLSDEDSTFMLELLNTDGWLKFIGNRHVSNKAEALEYIKKINGNTTIHYWSVCMKSDLQSIGMLTFIKRDYLAHNDVGFAFLPAYAGKGYAFEAASKLMAFLRDQKKIAPILATTIPGNTTSIKLLEKLGLHYEKKIMVEAQELLLYSTTPDK